MLLHSTRYVAAVAFGTRREDRTCLAHHFPMAMNSTVSGSDSPKGEGYQTTVTAVLNGTDEATEVSPLLAGSNQDHESEQSRLISSYRFFRTPRAIVLAIMVAVALTSFGDQLQESPTTRLLESIICYRHFERIDPSKINLPRNVVGPGAIGGVSEMFCKVDAVQDKLAMLIGIQSFLDGIPSLVLAIPFGWAADNHGRWPFLFLNLVQFALRVAWVQIVTWKWQSFNVTAIWFQSVFAVLGGGDAVVSALFFVSISDVVAEKDRAGAFLRLGAANLSANLFMPPLAAVLMQRSPYIPTLLGLGLQASAAVLYLFVPETLLHGRASRATLVSAESEPVPATTVHTNFFTLAWRKVRATTAFLTRDWRVPALIAPFALHILLAGSTRLLLQYISKRYNLTFSSATLVVTVRNAGQVLILFMILPFVSKLVMTRLTLSSQRKDIVLARASQCLVAIGLLGLAASPNVPSVAISLAIASLGTGTMFLVRSFLTSIVPVHEVARTYSVISIVDTIGLMFGSPMLAGLFSQGLEVGGSWIALPFYFLAMLSLCFVALLFVVRLRKGEGEQAKSTSNEEVVEGEGEGGEL